MPVTHEIWLKTDLKRPITVQPLHGLLFSADNQGDKVGFEVYDDGSPVTLSGVITGYIIKNNGETVVVSGSFDGNRAWIICPANAYDAIGPIYIAIKNRASTSSTAVTTTLGMCTTYVERTATGDIVTPTYKIVDAATIASMITQMETATAAANTAASSANTAAAAANTAAGRTENMDATATTLAPGSAATANVSTVSGHYRIAIGVPKGDIGPVAEITGTPTSTYQVGDDGTAIPTGTWLDNIPVVPQGSFLWTRTVITWNNGQSTTIYSPSRQGRDGSGSVSSVNDVSPDSNGNVDLGAIVHKVNNVSPDSSGNVALPVDSTPTDGSNNPVSSGGAYTALAEKVSKSGDAMTGALSTTADYKVLYMDADTENPPAASNNKDVFTVLDKNGNTIAICRAINAADGRMGIQIGTRRMVNGSAVFNTIQLLTGADGTAYVDLSYQNKWRDAIIPAEDFSSKISFSVSAQVITATKQGNICVLEYQSTATAITTDKLLFTLPSGYRPQKSLYVAGAVSSPPVGALIQFNAYNGQVILHNTASSVSSNVGIYISFSYAVN